MDLRSESWLGGRRGLVAGIADEHSIAYGCARMFQDCGTELAMTWLNDKARGYLGPLARELSATIMMPLDVGQVGAMEAVVDCLRERRGRLDFLLNAIAYAPRQSRITLSRPHRWVDRAVAPDWVEKPARGDARKHCVAARSADHVIMESLGNMKSVIIRAIRADDKERIAKAFRALEPGSIYLRFFSHKKELSGDELRRLTEPDRAREAALVATIGSGDEETIIGLGEYAGDGRSAHIAFAVEEDYQGRGIASRLLRNLAHLARANGVAQFEADVLVENMPMLNALRHSGLPVRESESDGIVHITLFLGDGIGNA